jgi:hypothetical protein
MFRWPLNPVCPTEPLYRAADSCAQERALEPKRLVLLDAGHFEVYGEAFNAAASSAVVWFKTHL